MAGGSSGDATAPPPRGFLLLGNGFAVAASLLVLGAYVFHAGALVLYPWDWSPDEGLFVGWARALLETPGALYRKTFVPLPEAYGPVLPALLAPIVATLPQPLSASRLLAAAWTALGAGAVYRLARREAAMPVALASAALALAPFDLSFWHMLVRVDGLMTALWLLAALRLLPARLQPGADRLSSGRLIAGSALLLAALLTKPTAVLHGAPLVLGWLLVDLRSALRLAAGLGAAGLAVLALMQAVTSGAYLWIHGFWGKHPSISGLFGETVLFFAAQTAPLVVLILAGILLALRRGARPLADSSWLLLAGGLLTVPTLNKYGSYWNYLLPVLPALALTAGRLWGRAAASAGAGPLLKSVAAVPVAATALFLAATRQFPVPSDLDGLTARSFYASVRQFTERFGGPILASRPEYAYFVAHQLVEIEGSGFPILAFHRAPGSERVLAGLEGGVYTLLIETWSLPSFGGYREAIERHYRHVGGCQLGYFFGGVDAHLYVRRDIKAGFASPAGARCGGPTAERPPPSPGAKLFAPPASP